MRTIRRWLPIPLLALSLSAAHADPPLPALNRDEPLRTQLSAKSLPLARSDQEKDAIPEPRTAFSFHLHKGAGLELSKPLRVADHDLVFGLKGPLMKRNRFGLAFEVRF